MVLAAGVLAPLWAAGCADGLEAALRREGPTTYIQEPPPPFLSTPSSAAAAPLPSSPAVTAMGDLGHPQGQSPFDHLSFYQELCRDLALQGF